MLTLLIVASVVGLLGWGFHRLMSNFSAELSMYLHRGRYPDSPLGYMEPKEFNKRMKESRKREKARKKMVRPM